MSCLGWLRRWPLFVFLLLLPASTGAEVVATWYVGEVSGLAVDRDGIVWFTQRAALNLGRLDPASGDLTLYPIPYQSGARYDGPGNPETILVDAAGDVWFTEIPMNAGGGEARLARFDPDTETFTEWVMNPIWWNGYGGSISIGAFGLYEGPDGRIWFNDRAGTRDARFGSVDPASGAIIYYTSPPAATLWSGRVDIAVGVDGTVWLSNGVHRDGHALYSFVEATGTFESLGLDGAGGLAADSLGNLWVSTFGPELLQFTPEGTLLSHPVPGQTRDVAVDSLDRVWFVSFNLRRLEPSTGDVTTIEGTYGARLIHVDPSDRLWIGWGREIGLVSLGRPPVALCRDVTVAADGACLAEASVDAGSHDPDGEPVTLSQDPPPPYALGVTTVTLTAADPGGLAAECEARVTVEDVTPPAVECNAPAALSPPECPATWTATATDNCGAVSVEAADFDCWADNGSGRRIDKTESCVVTLEGASATIADSGGVGTWIEWTARSADGAGNTGSRRCAVEVVNPVQP